MRISLFHKPALYWTLLAIVLLALAGGFWYVNAFHSASEKAEKNAVVLVTETAPTEVEVVLGGEVSEEEMVNEEVGEESNLVSQVQPTVEKAELPKELPSEETFEEIGLLENDLSE
ncbi:MAG: hypothetical protein LBU27_07130 [Candidatus Peribacteria bacterium]|jgi:hypothetical protein|nr:hypothetical protein [Candidatus Peribacteria bacterium]